MKTAQFFITVLCVLASLTSAEEIQAAPTPVSADQFYFPKETQAQYGLKTTTSIMMNILNAGIEGYLAKPKK